MKLSQYIEIQQTDSNLFDSFIDYQVEVVSIATNEDPETLYQQSAVSIIDMYTDILKSLNGLKEGCKIINIDGINFNKKPFHKLTLGEYIDLEYYLVNKKYLELIATIYRVVIEDSTKGEVWEEHGSYIDIRANMFLEVDCNLVLGVVAEYNDWRDNFILKNKEFFQVDQEEEDLSLLSKADLEEIKKAERAEANKKQFAWERLIMDLCNDDITKFNDVTRLPVILVFNILSMKKIYN